MTVFWHTFWVALLLVIGSATATRLWLAAEAARGALRSTGLLSVAAVVTAGTFAGMIAMITEFTR